MSLEPQTVDISFDQGIDTYRDPKTMPGQLTMLKNAATRRKGEIGKRYGMDLIKKQSGMGTGKALATFGDEILQHSSNRIYSYSMKQDNWSNRGDCYSVAVSTRQITRKTTAQGQADSAIGYGVELYGWQEPADQSVRYSIIDSQTKAFIVSDVAVGGFCKNVRCIAANNLLHLIWLDGGTLKWKVINPSTGASSDTSCVFDVDTTGQYDVVAVGTTYYLIYARVADIRIVPLEVNASLAVIPSPVISVATISEVATTVGISWVNENPTATQIRIGVSWFVAGAGTKFALFDAGLSSVVSPMVVDSDTGAVGSIGILGSNQIIFSIYIEKTNAATHRYLVRRVLVNTSGSIALAAYVFMRSVGLASKPFMSPDASSVLVCLVHSSTLQSTFFVADVNGTIVSRHLPASAGGIVTAGILPSVSVSSTDAKWAVINKTALQSRDGNLFSLTGVAQTSIEFDANSSFSAVEIGGTLHIVGGYLSMYDGISVVEHGFHLFPENLTTATGAGAIPAGTYLYCATYEWTDGKGMIHRSSPSVPVSVTLGGVGNVTVTVPTLRITAKKGTRSAVSVVLWRTMASQNGVFYRVSSVSAPTYNSTTTDTVAIVDNALDTAIAGNEILYTSGGVLENSYGPAARYIGVWQNRIVLAGMEDETTWAFSKTWTAGSPVEFAAEFTSGIDAEGGKLTGIAPIDDKLVIFKRDRYYMTYGEGPNDLGTGSFYPRPQLMPSDAGCIDQQSIQRVPDGIIFKSARGFQLLAASMAMAPIGDEVRAWLENNVTAAILVPDDNQVRFTHSDGPCLVLNYLTRQWSVFDDMTATDAVIWQNKFVILSTTTGEVYLENRDTFRDQGRAINIAIVTGWFNMAGISGFQRVYKMCMIGEYVSEHKLRVRVAYDYEPVWTDEAIINPANTITDTTYGSDATFGSGTPYGGSGVAYDFEVSLSRQKCKAVRFSIEEMTDSSASGSGEGLRLTGMSLKVGIKRGFGKKSYTRTSAFSG